MSDMDANLFVYGALLRPSHHKEWRLLRHGARMLGDAYFQGQLFNIGAFPGAILSEDGRDRVWGRLYRMNNPARLLPLLDQFEDCTPDDPEPHKFARKIIDVRLLAGGRSRAWTYLYNWDIARCRRIQGGRFHFRR